MCELVYIGIVQQYVKRVMVYNNKIVMEFNVFGGYTIIEEIER